MDPKKRTLLKVMLLTDDRADTGFIGRAADGQQGRGALRVHPGAGGVRERGAAGRVRLQGESDVPSQPTALLLGASRGLGLGLAREYLSRGWRVIATARGNAAKLEALEKSAKGNLRIERVDIADTDGVAELRDSAQRRKARPAVPRRRHFRLGAEAAARGVARRGRARVSHQRVLPDRGRGSVRRTCSSRRRPSRSCRRCSAASTQNDYGDVGNLPH